MTAELAILNNDSVALAADSAVTLSSFGETKTYYSKSKLFSFSEDIPVGMMFYGNAELLAVPVETLLKEFSKSVSGQLPKLEDYSKQFIEFLQSNMKKFFPRKHQEKKLLMTSIPFVSTVIRSIRLVLNETDREKFAATKKCLSIKEKQNKILKHFRSSLSVHKKDSSRISLKKKSINFIVSTVKSELKNELEADNSIGELLNEEIFGLVCELFVDYCADWTGGIGIVFAGYGEEDLYPSVKCLEIDTILDGCIKYRFNKINEFSVEEEIDEEKNLNVSKVIHYAQADEMTELFMHGITWGFRYYIIEKIEEKLKDASIKNADKILDEIENSIEDYSADTFYYPMNDFLFGLPRDELADMAEMLVKLTAFRQRVSSDGQSVGEPIDVAVISKSDGFVWHKKKESLTKR